MNMEQMEREAPEEEAKSAVPKSWELRRRRKLDEAGDLIATGVMAYALGSDGTVYYSDGRGVHTLPPGGGPARADPQEAARHAHLCLVIPDSMAEAGWNIACTRGRIGVVKPLWLNIC
jgi:hypothetical protein